MFLDRTFYPNCTRISVIIARLLTKISIKDYTSEQAIEKTHEMDIDISYSKPYTSKDISDDIMVR